jgi:hypothetical protein
MVPGFVRQGLLQQAPNFKLVLAKVLSKLVRGRYIKQCIALFFYLTQYVYFHNVIASPERAWQSHLIKTRSPRRFAPRDDTGIIAFVLVTKYSIILSLDLL